MKNILLVAATSAEINPLLKSFSFSLPSSALSSFSTEKHILHILITGVGMVNTSYHLTKTLIQIKPDLAINAGIAGSFSDEIPLGTIVRVCEDNFADLGAEDGKNFLSMDDLGFDSSKVEDEKSLHLFSEIFSSVPSVRAISVNRVHGDDESIQAVQKRLQPDIETMEGAAFTKICVEERIPQLQIRAVSNKVERRNRAAWNIPLAVQNLNEFLISFLHRLS